MKKLFLKLLFFSLPVLLGFYLLDKRLFSIPNTYNLKKSNLEKQHAQIKAVVVGSSQALYGINPDYISVPTYNLANSSQSLYYDKEILLKEIDKLNNLKCVILPISYFSLYYRLADSEEAWRSYYYYQYWGIDDSSIRKFDIRRYSIFALYTPSVSTSIIFNKFRTDFSNGISAKGYIWRDTTGNFNNISYETGKKRVAFHTAVMKKGNYQEVSNSCNELIQEMSKRGITVVIITPPVYETYSRFLDSNIMKVNDDFIRKACLNPHVMYYNFLFDKRFDKRDFVDNDHLNFIGAEKFSKIIDKEILSRVF